MTNKRMITITQAKLTAKQTGVNVLTQGSEEWLYTKDMGLLNMVGQTIHADIGSKSFDNGRTMYFLNDYTVPGNGTDASSGHATPASGGGQMAAPSIPRPTPAPTAIDRDASIVAQTLCKTVTFSNIGEAWQAYLQIYSQYERWKNPGSSPAEAQEQAVQDEWAQSSSEPNDDLPF